MAVMATEVTVGEALGMSAVAAMPVAYTGAAQDDLAHDPPRSPAAEA